MQLLETVSWNNILHHNIQCTDIVQHWKLIHNEICLFHGHWPQLGLDSLWPSHLGMEHHGPGNVDNSSIGSFSHSVLIVDTHSTEGHVLVIFSQLVWELTGSEDTIICVEIEVSHSHGRHLSFKFSLGSEILTGSEVDNRNNENKATCTIHKDDSTFDHPLMELTPSALKQPSRSGDNDTISRLS